MPAGAEAIRAERAARRAEAAKSPLPPVEANADRGTVIIRSAQVGTAVFAAATTVGAVVPGARIGVVLVDLVLFFGGGGFFLWGLVVAARRSREDQITLWNLILLEDVAPPGVRVQLLGLLAVQVVLAAATCWITVALAFGWLVPMWGLAHCELWGARYGVFNRRRPPPAAGPAAGGPRC
jgi:hypothetical protein